MHNIRTGTLWAPSQSNAIAGQVRCDLPIAGQVRCGPLLGYAHMNILRMPSLDRYSVAPATKCAIGICSYEHIAKCYRWSGTLSRDLTL